eukprot:1075038-Prorocentrum_minimum.AAC.3
MGIHRIADEVVKGGGCSHTDCRAHRPAQAREYGTLFSPVILEPAHWKAITHLRDDSRGSLAVVFQ